VRVFEVQGGLGEADFTPCDHQRPQFHAARQCAMMFLDKLVAHPETEASSTDAFRAEKASKTDPPPETLEELEDDIRR
jgi:hypothetical protein